MAARSGGGITLSRRKRGLLDALAKLHENKIIGEREYRDRLKLVEFQCDRWREERRKIHPPKKRGRPKAEDRSVFTICKKPGCGKPPAPGQRYCSVEHSPYGHMMMQPERKRR